MKSAKQLFTINDNSAWKKLFSDYQKNGRDPETATKLLPRLQKFLATLADTRSDTKLKINTLILIASAQNVAKNYPEARASYLAAHQHIYPRDSGKLSPPFAGQERVLYGIYRSMALINLHEHDHQKAFECLELAQQCDKDNPSIMFLRAVLEHHADNYIQCVELGEHARRMDKGGKRLTRDERVLLNYILANAYNEAGKSEKMAECLDRALMISPTRPELISANNEIRNLTFQGSPLEKAQNTLSDLIEIVQQGSTRDFSCYNINIPLDEHAR